MSDDTESTLSIQDEETENVASIVTSSDNIAINGLVALNPDGSTIGGEDE